jgi:AraC family transcriptional activator of mtrCDE
VAERINLEAPGMTRPVDTLSGLALLLRVRPELQQLCRFGAQWSSDHSSEAEGWAPFHFVTQGTCIIELSGRSIPLSAGDVAVLPRGRRHSVRGPTTPAGARGPFGIRSSFLGAVDLKSNTDASPRRSSYAVDCTSSSRSTISCLRRRLMLSQFPPPRAVQLHPVC